jgi:hypothetical protein
MENDKIRTSRASQTRTKAEAKKVWTPPNSLDAPPAPTGYRHQWIRAEILGQQDTKNVASSLREGYELVRAEEYPESNYNDLLKEQHPSMKFQKESNTRVTFGGTKKS